MASVLANTDRTLFPGLTNICGSNRLQNILFLTKAGPDIYSFVTFPRPAWILEVASSNHHGLWASTEWPPDFPSIAVYIRKRCVTTSTSLTGSTNEQNVQAGTALGNDVVTNDGQSNTCPKTPGEHANARKSHPRTSCEISIVRCRHDS